MKSTFNISVNPKWLSMIILVCESRIATQMRRRNRGHGCPDHKTSQSLHVSRKENSRLNHTRTQRKQKYISSDFSLSEMKKTANKEFSNSLTQIIRQLRIDNHYQISQLVHLELYECLIFLEIFMCHFHQSNETPECINFVFHHEKKWRCEIRHSLHITQIEVVHNVGHKNIVKMNQIHVVFSLEEWNSPISSCNVLF